LTEVVVNSNFKNALHAILDFCAPSFRLTGTGYELLWQQERRLRDSQFLRKAVIVLGIGFLIQYLTVDMNVNLQPVEFWFSYRFSFVFCMISIFVLLRNSEGIRWNIGRWLFAFAGFSAALLQAYGTVLEPKTPLVFSVLICAGAAALTPGSGVFALCLYLTASFLQFQIFAPLRVNSPDLAAQIFSLNVVGLALLVIIKAAQIGHIQKFLTEMREIERQKQIISLQTDLVSQLRSFLPKVIFERINGYKKTYRTSFEYATQEILRPRTAEIACLWSDIRGFTKASSTESEYVQNIAAPNLRHLTDLSESFGAIPRIIGDLLLCYYDEKDANVAVMNSLKTATEIIKATEKWNDFHGSEKSLDRVVLLAWGTALVGNVGGSASSREITALGPCVNQLARLDEAIGQMFRREDRSLSCQIVATPEFISRAKSLGFSFDVAEVDFSASKIAVRDFPEMTKVFVVKSFVHPQVGLEFTSVGSKETQLNVSDPSNLRSAV